MGQSIYMCVDKPVRVVDRVGLRLIDDAGGDRCTK